MNSRSTTSLKPHALVADNPMQQVPIRETMVSDATRHKANRRRIGSAVVAGMICLLALGCGGQQLPQVTGTITVDGKPAEGAVLLFHPNGGGATSIGSAVAASDGTYRIVSNQNPGIPPGKYLVTVSWPDPSYKPPERDVMLGTAESGPDLLKGRYISKAKSDMEVEIDGTTKQLDPIALKLP